LVIRKTYRAKGKYHKFRIDRCVPSGSVLLHRTGYFCRLRNVYRICGQSVISGSHAPLFIDGGRFYARLFILATLPQKVGLQLQSGCPHPIHCPRNILGLLCGASCFGGISGCDSPDLRIIQEAYMKRGWILSIVCLMLLAVFSPAEAKQAVLMEIDGMTCSL